LLSNRVELSSAEARVEGVKRGSVGGVELRAPEDHLRALDSPTVGSWVGAVSNERGTSSYPCTLKHKPGTLRVSG